MKPAVDQMGTDLIWKGVLSCLSDVLNKSNWNDLRGRES